MRLLKVIQSLLFFLFMLSSCNFGENQKNKVGEIDFGEVNPREVIEKTLTFEFNSAAQNDKSTFLEFEFVDKQGKGVQDIIFKLADKVINNKFRITPADVDPNGKVRVGIMFPKNAKEQDYFGYLMLINASNDLQQNISLNDTTNVINLHNKIADFHAKYEIPMASWLYWSILFGSVLSFLAIVILILTRDNMPFGKTTFKFGTLGFPGGELSSVKLEKLAVYDLSKVFGIQPGLTIEPYDKRVGSAKKRFARVRNKTDLVIKNNYDGIDQIIGATEDFYNMDELKIYTPENKVLLVTYTNNKNVRTFNS